MGGKKSSEKHRLSDKFEKMNGEPSNYPTPNRIRKGRKLWITGQSGQPLDLHGLPHAKKKESLGVG